MRYKNQWKNFSDITIKYAIKLFPLGNPDVWQKIENLENKANTILLLDAFDEDVKALDDHKKRMNEILGKVQEFKEIVITCRTQFFPSEEEEPTKTGYYSFGESGEYKFQKLYLSVFDDSDVKKYLRKRFSVFSLSKYFKAKEIVKKCPNLIVRPMLLSRINDLIDSDRQFNYTFEIYEELINKWIERESRKFGIREKYGSSENYQTLLYNFSKALALDLYNNNEKRGGYLISTNEEISSHSKTGLKLSDIEDEYKTLSLTEKEARTQSLLNRNSKGQYKFSHKSFLEYFLAYEVSVNYDFFLKFNFEGMSAAQSFAKERSTYTLTNFEGSYKTEGIGIMKSLSKITQDEIEKIQNLTITKHQKNLIPLFLLDLKSIKSFTFYDHEKFKDLYITYSKFYWLMSLNSSYLEDLRRTLNNSNLTLGKNYQEILELLNLPHLWNIDNCSEKLKQLSLPGLAAQFRKPNFEESVEKVVGNNLLNADIRIDKSVADKTIKELPKNILNEPNKKFPPNNVYDLITELNWIDKFLTNNFGSSKKYANFIKNVKEAEPFLKVLSDFQEKHPECKMNY